MIITVQCGRASWPRVGLVKWASFLFCGDVPEVSSSRNALRAEKEGPCASGGPALWRAFLEKAEVALWCLRLAWAGCAIQTGPLVSVSPPFGVVSDPLPPEWGGSNMWGRRFLEHMHLGLCWDCVASPWVKEDGWVSRSLLLSGALLLLQHELRWARQNAAGILIWGASEYSKNKTKPNLLGPAYSWGGGGGYMHHFTLARVLYRNSISIFICWGLYWPYHPMDLSPFSPWGLEAGL